MGETVIRAEGIAKEYILGQIGSGTLKHDIQSLMARMRHKEDPNQKIGREFGKKGDGDKFLALEDVSFDIHRGEAIGLIGRNGAGKSTLLKVISRITAPTRGTVKIRGRVASLLEVGTGFNPELTGRENVFLNGAIMGMTRAETARKLDEIIAFSEIEQFIDTPVKRYSSGMYVKLGFAVAAHLDPDILICDEVLAVGDVRYQEKCLKKMSEVSGGNRTVIYVSHNMRTVRQLCNRCLYLEDGHLNYDGDPDEAISRYIGAAKVDSLEHDFSACRHLDNMGRIARMDSLLILDADSCEFPLNGQLRFRLNWHTYAEAKNVRVSVKLTHGGEEVVATTLSNEIRDAAADCAYADDFRLSLEGLAPGEYGANVMLYLVDGFGRQVRFDHVPQAFRFVITPDAEKTQGIVWTEKEFGLFRLPDIRHE